jgi:hypothetical protein
MKISNEKTFTQILDEYRFMRILDEFFKMQILDEYTFMWILDEMILMQIPDEYTFMWILDEIFLKCKFRTNIHLCNFWMKNIDIEVPHPLEW